MSGTSPVPRRPRAGSVERELVRLVGELQAEIRDYTTAHPRAGIEVTWRVVGEDGP